MRHDRAHAGAKKTHRMLARFHGARAGKRSRRPARGRVKPGRGKPVHGTGDPANAPAGGSSAAGAAGQAPAPSTGREPRFGVFTDGAPYGGDVASVDRLQAALGRPIDIVNWYQSWGGGDWVSQVQDSVIGAVTRSGRTPLLTWEPWDPAAGADQPAFRLRRIADGEFDAYLTAWAQELKATGSEIYLRPMHEMNGDWYPWGASVGDNSPELYVRAWRHMHDVFAANGATNVRWVWNPVPYSQPHTPENDLERYYPGDRYVDWVGLSGFNWGPESVYPTERSFLATFQPSVDVLEALGKPVMLAEIGTSALSRDPAGWLRSALDGVKELPAVKSVVWFDADTPDADFRLRAPALDVLRSAGDERRLSPPLRTRVAP